VTTYKLKEDTEGRTRKSFIKFLPMVFLASMPALILAFAASKEAPFVLYFMLFALISAIIIAYFLAKSRRPTFLLTVTEESVALHQSGKADVCIQRNEIKTIFNEHTGLRIKSIDPSVEIFIPNDLEHYDTLKLELNTWSIIEDGQKNKTRQTVILVFVILMLIGGYLTKNPFFGYTLLALLTGYVVYLYSQNFKVLIVTKDRWKRIRIIISFVLFGLIILSYILKYIQ
jgi:hypothetical protein